ncbi:MAG: hypothetical protein IJM59_04810 [Proteobacteria bacterium]|nr:hypothetical protein [Pseudomonadota bacterium]
MHHIHTLLQISVLALSSAFLISCASAKGTSDTKTAAEYQPETAASNPSLSAPSQPETQAAQPETQAAQPEAHAPQNTDQGLSNPEQPIPSSAAQPEQLEGQKPVKDDSPAESTGNPSGSVPTDAAKQPDKSVTTTQTQPQQPPEPPPELHLTEVQMLSESGNHKSARQLALKNLRSGKSKDASEFWEAIESDPLFSHTMDEEVQPHGTNAISALGGGSTVSFKYTDSADESAKAALKPDQDLRQTMYRSGIAYYRICQILGCSFDIPVTRPARFSKSNFNTLYNASGSSKNSGYRSKFEHLIWAKEGNSSYLYVGYKEWISPFTGFPIEVTSVWSPYLKNPDANLPEVKSFLKAILSGGRADAVKHLGTLTEYAGNLTTRDILHQISDMILMDYLSNNWDRFAGEQNNFGANCHFHPGGIIAIDNDAAFPAWHAPRVVRRLNMVEMFSKDMVENLRTLDPDELMHHLFPNPTKEELKSFERFKERRRDALKYIDDLIQKKGKDKVLVF